MRIYRTTPTRSFSTFTNELLRDTSISWCAVGVLTYLLSLPPGAQASIRTLAKQRKEGRARIANALHELEESRYLKRAILKDPENGQLSTVYHVFDHRYSDGVDEGEEDTGENGRNLAPGDRESGVSGPLPTGEKTEGQEPPSPVRERARRVAQKRPTPRAVLPKPSVPEQLRSATELLLSLGRREPRLALGTFEAVRLAPLVEEWRDCGASDAQVTQALIAGLPTPVLSAPGLIANRLRRKAPSPLPMGDPAGRSPSQSRMGAECEECRAPLPSAGAACHACAPTPLNAAARGFVDAAKRGGAKVRAALTAPPAPAVPGLV